MKGSCAIGSSLHRAPATLTVLMILAAALPAEADLRIDRERVVEFHDRSGNFDTDDTLIHKETVFVGQRSARVDIATGSVIVRMEDGVYLWLDHEAKAYAEATLPLKLEALFTEDEKHCLQQISSGILRVDASVELTDERRRISRLETRKLRVVGRHPAGFQIEREEWLTQDLPVDLTPYHEVLLQRGELSPATRGWRKEAIAFGGYAVESTVKFRSRRGALRVSKQRLVSVEEVPADAARYLPPADYSPSWSRPPIDMACGTPKSLVRPK